MTQAPGKPASPAGSGAPVDWSRPRPADLVMRPDRVAAVFPTALSFARTLFDKLYDGHWTLDRLRMDLDAQGRGEVLYRLSDGRNPLYFFILSNSYSTADKADRSFNMNWDGMAALCEGAWTPEREDYLRRELPKQRFGRLDHQTLAYTRGNRSGRIFDQVVEALAKGHQPDGAALARIGYIFRTTGFTANGFIGMRSYLGMESDHLLSGPYHAQMCGAFLLREYVADLVDAMAQARNPAAARLSPAMRRYLGIGNSAGLGLTPFIYNHPAMVDRWTRLKEEALADVRRTPVSDAGDPAIARFRVILARARRYFTEDPREANMVFASYAEIAENLNRALTWTEAGLFAGDLAGRPVWADLSAWAEAHLHPEAAEVLNTILLELYPEITRRYARDLTVDETLDYDPAMTVGDLKTLIARRYGWAETCFQDLPAAARTFWYMSTEAPYEPRRGYRGPLPDYEFETHMDAPLRFRQLQALIAGMAGDLPLADLLARHPEMRNIVNRLVTLADAAYAELRENTLAEGHLTFGSTRFLLSHYGMDRLDAQWPRSVKGVLMQGAPTGADLNARTDPDWPFPVVPQAEAASPTPAPAPAYHEDRQRGARELRQLDPWQETEFGERMTIAPVELLRWGQRALQARGCPFGLSISGAWLAHLQEILFGTGIAQVIAAGEARQMAPDPARGGVRRAGGWTHLDPAAASAFTALPSLLDLAGHAAARDGTGHARAGGLQGLALARVLPLWAMQRGQSCLVLWSGADGLWQAVSGGRDAQGPWLALRDCGPAAPEHLLPEPLGAARPAGDGSLCLVLCHADPAAAPRDLGEGTRLLCPDDEIGRAYRSGVAVRFAQLEEVKAMAFETLVPAEREEPITTE